MVLYVILIFVAILIGMAVSVAAFGTGGKRSRIFRDIYYTVEEVEGIGVLYTKNGDYSAVLAMENPVQKYSANIDAYYEFTSLLTSLTQTLGEGYALHKQDIFCRRRFRAPEGSREFLSDCYFRYFAGREYTDALTFLVITQESRGSKLFSYDARKWRDFMVKVRKVRDQLKDAGIACRFLDRKEASDYVDRYFALDFTSPTVSMTGLKVDEEVISLGDRRCKFYSLVDVDSVALPQLIRPFTSIEVNNSSMPVDLVGAVDSVPESLTVVYNQVVFMPGQKKEMAALEKKRNRHGSIPSPANQMAVEDIKNVQEVIAREGKQLVYCHFSIGVVTPREVDIHKCTNYLENAFGRQGIHISKRAYNQLELFVGSFPGNCYALSPEYDRFLTLGDAAACLMYKERTVRSEDTPLKIWYTPGRAGGHRHQREGGQGEDHGQRELLLPRPVRQRQVVPHELRRPPDVGAGHGHRHGRHGQLLRGPLRIRRRQVYQLHRGAPDHHEPLPHHARGIQHREGGVPEEPRDAHLEGHDGHRHEDRGQAHRADHHGVL